MKTFLTFCFVLILVCESLVVGQQGIGPGPGTPHSSGSSSLNTNLISYWKMDEVAGSRADSTATGATLSDNGVTLFGSGIISNAALFNGTSQYLTAADSAALSTGDIDFTVSAWVYIHAKNNSNAIINKGDLNAGPWEYQLERRNATDRFRFFVSDGSVSGNVEATTFGAPTLDTWYLVIAWHDSVANTVNITVNAGATDSTSYSSGGNDTANGLCIGRPNLYNGEYLDGRVDEVGFWKKVLSASERTELYNSGAGKTCCPF